MHIVILGVNHKTAPIEIRERFFLNPTQQDLLLSELKSDPKVLEAIVLSTCNRIEIYARTIQDANDRDFLVKHLLNVKKINSAHDLQQYFYFYQNEEAVRHFLKVTAGLDSLMLGEKQIIGQVKSSVDRAREMKMLDRHFNILSNVAIRTAKKAQTDTEISHGGSSISWAAMTMAENLLGTLEGKSILIIGAGKMGELTLEQIRNKGVKNIYLMNRTGSAAQSLAEAHNGIPVSFDEIKETLAEVDVCVCAASAPHYILEKKGVEKVMTLKRDRKLILIDISMPRNIDPQVASIESVYLSCIDDLDRVVNENMRKRQSAVSAVESIITQKLHEYYEKLSKLKDNDFTPQTPESIEIL